MRHAQPDWWTAARSLCLPDAKVKQLKELMQGVSICSFIVREDDSFSLLLDNIILRGVFHAFFMDAIVVSGQIPHILFRQTLISYI